MASLENDNVELESHRRIEQVRKLKPGSRVYVCGICGTGMAAVAQLLKEKGFVVSGSDKAFYPPMGDLVKQITRDIYDGYDAAHLEKRPDLVVIGNSIRRDNPEAVRTLSENIPYASMPEVFAALLIGERETDCPTSIVVAGTHGKTTTSAMIATMFDASGRKPGFFIGGAPNNFDRGVRPVACDVHLEKRVVVLEGDEYDSAFFLKRPKFHSYRPDILVITSIEFDHADIYRSVEEIEAEFTKLVRRLPNSGVILVSQNSERLCKLVQEWKRDPEIAAEIIAYGVEAGFPYQILHREATKSGQRIIVKFQGKELSLESEMLGEHNALNVLATAAVGDLLGLNKEEIAEGVRRYKGVKRRQQIIGEIGEILIIEDFAHHPTAVKSTIDGIKERFPSRRLIAAFEPRSNTSRRAFFQEDYAKSFSGADMTLILEVSDAGGYSAFEGEIKPLDVPRLVCEISKNGHPAWSFGSVKQIEAKLAEVIKPKDVILLMSNGDFGGLPQSLPAILKKQLV